MPLSDLDFVKVDLAVGLWGDEQGNGIPGRDGLGGGGGVRGHDEDPRDWDLP